MLELRDQFRTSECIFGVLYANKNDEKINTDRSTNKKPQTDGDIGPQKKASKLLRSEQQNKI